MRWLLLTAIVGFWTYLWVSESARVVSTYIPRVDAKNDLGPKRRQILGDTPFPKRRSTEAPTEQPANRRPNVSDDGEPMHTHSTKASCYFIVTCIVECTHRAAYDEYRYLEDSEMVKVCKRLKDTEYMFNQVYFKYRIDTKTLDMCIRPCYEQLYKELKSEERDAD